MSPRTSLTTILVISYLSVFSQSRNLNTRHFKFGLSYGNVSEQSTDHAGLSISTGMEFNVISDRIRFNPFISLGYHHGISNSSINEHYYPISLETIFLLDLIRNSDNSFAWFIGIGPYGNITPGAGTMGSFGGYAGTGLILRPQAFPISFEVLPLNYMLGYGPRKNFFGRVCLLYDLN